MQAPWQQDKVREKVNECRGPGGRAGSGVRGSGGQGVRRSGVR